MNRNYALDVTKCIAVIAVVVIHATADLYYKGVSTQLNYGWYRPGLNFAVPFFFAASGYLLYTKTKGSESNDYIWRYALKILSYYVGATLFYMLFALAIAISDRLFLDSPWRPAVKKILGGWNYNSLLNGSLGWFHLYFLVALFAACLLLMLWKGLRLDAKSILLVGSIGYLLTLVGYIKIDTLFPLGGPLKGFFYLAIGYFVASVDIRRFRHPGLGLLASAVLYYACNLWLYSLITVPLAFFTFYLMALISKHFDFGRGSVVAAWGTFTLVIYVFHDAARVLVERAFVYLGMSSYYELPVFYLIAIPFSFFAPLAVAALLKPVSSRIWGPRGLSLLSDNPEPVSR